MALTEWNMLVKKVFNNGRASNAAYRLKDAMKDAKKVYRKTAKTVGSVASIVVPRGRGRKRTQRRRRGTRRTNRRRR